MTFPQLGLDLLSLVAVVALVLANGFFVATEFSLVAVRRSELELWVRQGRLGAASAKRAVLHLDDAIATTQLGITIASLALGWIGEPAVASLIEPSLRVVGVTTAGALHGTATAVAFTAITFLHVVVGELAPKALALDRPGPVALACARPLLVFGRVFRFVLVVMNGAGNRLVTLFGVRPAGSAHRVHSAEELSLLVSEAREAGEFRPEQGRILGRVLHIADRKVRDLMVPRERICAVERHVDPEALLDRIREEGFTRLPVYDGQLDHMVGILHTKDLFHVYAKTRLVLIEDAIRPAVEIGPEASIGDALRLFRRTRRHMAVVREPGAPLLGIITLEDVLEEIVGDIEDEHDEPTPAGVE
ncbi:MAG TPA: hemolysin family protein [Myxococcota bacterium]|jgi:CBS domain containing-hemolysin-like protein|nr:hemolysin family protein [Myxococcota bacterium]